MTIYSLDVLLSVFGTVCFSTSSFNCHFLTCIKISQEADKVVWYSPLFKNFPQFGVIPTVKGFSQWNRSRCFSGILLLLLWSSGCWQSDLWFFCLFLIQLVHLEVLSSCVKPSLDNFEHYFASVWDEYNCAVVRTFFVIVFLWDWNENWPFSVLWPLMSFPKLLAYCMQHFHSINFRIWNSSTGIP